MREDSATPCRDCAMLVQDGSNFCPACGRSVHRGVADAERRQLTVLFCDMVDYTGLAERLDPEDLGELLNSFHRVCQDAIVRHKGYVFQFLGDGVLAYFGFPVALEDAAVCAVRASLAMFKAIHRLNHDIAHRFDTQIRVRAGLHTGVVVIRANLGGSEDLAVGDSVNLAARIQGCAPTDAVLVSASTAKLIRGHFELESLNEHTLKGFSKPVELFRVLRPTGARTKFEAAARGKLTPHVGRERELARLAEAWEAVKNGARRTVLVRGEPGIGKSRVVHQFRRLALEHGVLVLECFCSPLGEATALSPIIELIEARVLEKTRGATDDESRLDALRGMLGEHSCLGPDALPLMAALLSIPVPERELAPIQELSPVRRRVRTLELLRDWLVSSAQPATAALLFEDVQWADPSTLEFLDLLVRDGASRTLLCMTARPEFPTRWDERSVETIELQRLNVSEIDRMVANVEGSDVLPPEIVRQIVERSEGVPLYVEEITKLVLDRLASGDDEFVIRGGDRLLPATLRGALEARIDQVGSGRQTAQLGAAIGREFTYELIRAIAGGAEDELQEQLRCLYRSELAFAQGAPPLSTYTFKHALIQDAIYETIPKSKRAAFHERIFSALESKFPESVENRPETAAYHAQKANRIYDAVRLLRDAGVKALGRTALAEAVRHLRRGLELVERLPEPTRSELELELQAAIGPAYMATLGWAAPAVERASQRLLELATARVDHERIYLAMWSLWTVHFVRGDLHAAADVARQVYGVAKSSGDAMLRITGCHALGYSCYFRAELEDARRIAKEAFAISTLEIERQIASTFQVSSGSIAYGFCVTAHWLLGEQDQAAELTNRWHELLDQLQHAPTMALSLAHEGYLLHMQREPKKLLALSQRLRTISEQEGFILWISMSYVFEAWALAHEGHVSDAVEQMNTAIAGWRATRAQLTMCDNIVMQVEVLLLADRADEALCAIAEGKEVCARSGERTLEPELYRLEGEALDALGRRDEALLASFTAVERARELRALSLELRAATQVHRFQRTSGSLAQLRSVYARFSEGFDKPDLRAARVYLNAGVEAYVEQTVGT